jgi:hypothetical protein
VQFRLLLREIRPHAAAEVIEQKGSAKVLMECPFECIICGNEEIHEALLWNEGRNDTSASTVTGERNRSVVVGGNRSADRS